LKVKTFRGPCTPSVNVTAAGQVEDVLAGSLAERISYFQCTRQDSFCNIKVDHSMRARCSAHERTPPFVIALAYSPGHNFDNLVVEVFDLNPGDMPNSLTVSLYMGRGSHETLAFARPLDTTAIARDRVFSLGLNTIELSENLCDGVCNTTGTGYLSLVVACNHNDVRMSVLATAVKVKASDFAPTNGEVCPELWSYHMIRVPHNASGVRVHIEVLKGDVYYAMSRWDTQPSFASCNANEMPMSDMHHGHVDLCNAKEHSDKKYGHIGLYGGTFCAVYVISVSALGPDDSCSTETTGICDVLAHASAATALRATAVAWALAVPCAIVLLGGRCMWGF